MTRGLEATSARQPFGDLGPVVHDDDAVGKLHDQIELVLDQQDGDAGALEARG